MSRWLPVALILLCGTLDAQQQGAVDVDAAAKPLAGKAVWPTVGGNLTRTSVASGPKIDRFPAPRWALSLTPFRNSFSAPTVGYGRVFLPIGNNHSLPNRLISVDAKTGREHWSQDSAGWLGGTCPALGAGKVFFGGGDDTVRCLDARTGKLLWSMMCGSHFWSHPLIADGVAYIACKDNTFYAFDLATGEVTWQYKGENHSKSSPALADGKLVIGEREQSVICLSVKDGTKLWTFETDGWTDTPITIVDGIVFAGTKEGTVYAIGLGDGKKRWSRPTGAAVRGPFATADGLVVAGNADGHVIAFEVKSGKQRWKAKAAGAVRGGAIILGERVLYADAAGHLTSRTLADGALVWSVKMGASFLAPMAGDGEALFLVDAGEATDQKISGEYAMRSKARLLCVVDGWTEFGVLGTVLGVKPAAPVERIARLIKLLGADEYPVREGAEAQLAGIGQPAARQLNEALETTADWEIRERAGRLLKKLGAALETAGKERLVRHFALARNVEYLIHWLADAGDAKTRAAVHRKLSGILDGLPPFDAVADPRTRAAQINAIRTAWTARKAELLWNPTAGKYVPKTQ